MFGQSIYSIILGMITKNPALFQCAKIFVILILITSSVFSQNITTSNGEFIDQQGRTRYFRGINLAGSSKVPFSTDCKEETVLCKNISFVGRPFPLETADIHLKRLQQWGFNLIRLIVTWEALEHEGPGIYDSQYISYITHIIKKADAYGLKVVIDPHQDVWSRFTGGDGAPLWTLEAAGFNIHNFESTNAALVYEDPKAEIPSMIWPTNYTKLGSASMFTLFFGGKDFAPKTTINDINIQDYLQQHYIAAYTHLASFLQTLPNVIGFEVMNEPHPGWIGQKSISDYSRFPLRNKATPTPAQAMALGAGNTLEVANWKVGLLGLKEDGVVEVNTKKLSAWKHDSLDIWKKHQVWTDVNGKFTINKDDYFNAVNEHLVDFSQDYYVPFILKFTEAIRTQMPNTLIFIEKPFESSFPKIEGVNSLVNATHWYDQITLIKKTYISWATLDLSTGSPVFGKKKIDLLFSEKLADIKALEKNLGPNAPTWIGEFGIPFDLSNKKSYNKTLFGNFNFTDQNLALDRSMRALESNQLSSALWNYTPDNKNAYGDLWNSEDFSIFSEDQIVSDQDNTINNGGRALRAVARPSVSAICGDLISSHFDIHTGIYTLHFNSSSFKGNVNTPSVIILPPFYFDEGFELDLSDGKLKASNNPIEWHYYMDANMEEHHITITPKKQMASIWSFNYWFLFIFLVISLLIFIRIKRKGRKKSLKS